MVFSLFFTEWYQCAIDNYIPQKEVFAMVKIPQLMIDIIGMDIGSMIKNID